MFNLLISVLVVGALFAVIWRTGNLARLVTYVQGTKEELKRCTWPTWAELKGSTLVVIISILLLGVFTMFLDAIFHYILVRVA